MATADSGGKENGDAFEPWEHGLVDDFLTCFNRLFRITCSDEFYHSFSSFCGSLRNDTDVFLFVFFRSLSSLFIDGSKT